MPLNPENATQINTTRYSYMHHPSTITVNPQTASISPNLSSKSPPSPQPRQATPPHPRTRRLDRPLLPHPAFLLPHARHDLLQVRFHHHAADNHLTQHRMHRLVPEDQVQLAHVLEHAVQRLHEDLDQVDQRERRLGGRGDHDEREGGVGAVGDLRGGVGGAVLDAGARALGEEGREGEEVAGAGGALGDELVDLVDERLFGLGVLVEGGLSVGGYPGW